MIPISRRPTDIIWSDVAAKEIELQEIDIVSESDVAYRLGNVAIAGLIYHSFTSPPWFWFALARDVSLGDLLDFRRFKEEIPRGAQTAVASNDYKANRFAKLYGFEKTNEVADYNGNPYSIYRRT